MPTGVPAAVSAAAGKVTQAGLGRLVGITPQMIARWAREGKIPFTKNRATGRKIFDVTEAIAAIDKFKPGTLDAFMGRSVAVVEDAPATAVEIDFKEAKVRHVIAQAEHVELQTARLAGSLVKRADVVAAWSAHIVRTREQVLAVPSRVMPRIAALLSETTAHQVRALIESEIDIALNAMADDRLRPEDVHPEQEDVLADAG